ncbi:MAG TPA: tRNA 2-selenouridine(34) synthase MnmH [Bacteroidales bacterium]|nr:tRNA 2-selenouridine(34) synthase MnmH [Bacteroidales bacterium]
MTSNLIRKTDIGQFLQLSAIIPVVDVRTPLEYMNGHIPGAVNIPLFENDERALVGTSYKKEGRRKAILKGLELSGPGMHLKLMKAMKTAPENRLLVHCWRGGMRSEAMAWLFSLAGIETYILEGGYKAYRNHVLSVLAERKKVIVLGGMTGSSKTHILRYLSSMGEQVIDLEGLANHKGSAFGALGKPPQPSSEHFSNMLAAEWSKLDKNRRVWLEDESRNIGTVFMPDQFFSHIRNSPAIILLINVKNRLPRLIEEYSGYPAEQLKESVMRISKRLGGDKTRAATEAIEKQDFGTAIEITLSYYDKAYMYGIRQRQGGQIIEIEADTDDISTNASSILEAAGRIRL